MTIIAFYRPLEFYGNFFLFVLLFHPFVFVIQRIPCANCNNNNQIPSPFGVTTRFYISGIYVFYFFRWPGSVPCSIFFLRCNMRTCGNNFVRTVLASKNRALFQFFLFLCRTNWSDGDLLYRRIYERGISARFTPLLVSCI